MIKKLRANESLLVELDKAIEDGTATCPESIGWYQDSCGAYRLWTFADGRQIEEHGYPTEDGGLFSEFWSV